MSATGSLIHCWHILSCVDLCGVAQYTSPIHWLAHSQLLTIMISYELHLETNYAETILIDYLRATVLQLTWTSFYHPGRVHRGKSNIKRIVEGRWRLYCKSVQLGIYIYRVLVSRLMISRLAAIQAVQTNSSQMSRKTTIVYQPEMSAWVMLMPLINALGQSCHPSTSTFSSPATETLMHPQH